MLPDSGSRIDMSNSEMKYQMEHSNGKQSEATESDAGVRIEVGMGMKWRSAAWT